MQETEVGYQSQRKMNAGSMVARGNFARHNELANSGPGCPVQNQDLASSEIHTSPLMMRCSCKCGCERMEAKLKTCSKCNRINCFAKCSVYHQCHWCLSYPEDTPQDCFACGTNYPRSEQRCRRCTASLCVACDSRGFRKLCTRCSYWLIAEINAFEKRTDCPTNCLICDAELDQESFERCLKCHAPKCWHCDVDHTFCIKCCSTRTAIHRSQNEDESYTTEEEAAIPTREPAGTMSGQDTHCSYCDQTYSNDEWERVSLCPVERLSERKQCTMGKMHTRCIQAHLLEHHSDTHCSHCDQVYLDVEWGQVDLCPVERRSQKERCTMGMMHTGCMQAHMLEHHPEVNCPMKYRQQERIRDSDFQVTPTQHQKVAHAGDIKTTATLVLADTIDIRTTATLVPEVPCCSHCQ